MYMNVKFNLSQNTVLSLQKHFSLNKLAAQLMHLTLELAFNLFLHFW